MVVLNPHSATVWKMVSSCLLWCLWRELNDRRFEDHKRMVVELKSFLFNIFYLWITALDFPNVLDFLDFFFPF
jgi:hypothetical protein